VTFDATEGPAIFVPPVQPGFLSKLGSSASTSAQGCPLSRQMCIVGRNQPGSSSAAAFNTTTDSMAESSENKGEPQVGQKLRVTSLPLSAVTVYWVVAPVIATASRGSITIVEYAPPDAYWQSRQWQFATMDGSADTVILTCPQRQPALNESI